jgi:predicted transcriptional regulator
MFLSEVVTVDQKPTPKRSPKMQQENVGVVVVEDGYVAGIITDRDIALKLALGESKLGTPVKEIMTKDVITIWDDQGVFNATQYMIGHKIRRLPIINRADRLIGMVTSDDLLCLLAREFSNVAKAIEPHCCEVFLGANQFTSRTCKSI